MNPYTLPRKTSLNSPPSQALYTHPPQKSTQSPKQQQQQLGANPSSGEKNKIRNSDFRAQRKKRFVLPGRPRASAPRRDAYFSLPLSRSTGASRARARARWDTAARIGAEDGVYSLPGSALLLPAWFVAPALREVAPFGAGWMERWMFVRGSWISGIFRSGYCALDVIVGGKVQQYKWLHVWRGSTRVDWVGIRGRSLFRWKRGNLVHGRREYCWSRSSGHWE